MILSKIYLYHLLEYDELKWNRIRILLKWIPEYIDLVSVYCVKYDKLKLLQELFYDFTWTSNENLLIYAAKNNSFQCLHWVLKRQIFNSVNEMNATGFYAFDFATTFECEFELLWYGSKFNPKTPMYYKKVHDLKEQGILYQVAKRWIFKQYKLHMSG